MIIDSDILIDFARKEEKAVAFLEMALLEDDSLATRNRRHFIFIDGLQLVDY